MTTTPSITQKTYRPCPRSNRNRQEGPLGACPHVAMPLWPSLLGRWKPGQKAAPGASAPLPTQDFEALQEQCLRDGCLFEDSSFPATLSSIGSGPLLRKLPPCLQWRRPPELHSNPHFYSAEAKRLDLCQGLVGDCWFLAALQALTLHQDILSQVVPLNQSFTKKYAGIFQFRFWHFGKWVPVVIDDRLPVTEAGQLVFVSSTYKNLFWGALLEKAYAKLCGSYEDLQHGEVSDALLDFTGGVTVTIKLAEAPGNLWDILAGAIYGRTLIGCQTHLGNERVLENGLVDGHAYTLIGIRKVTCKHAPEYLVKLRNPWGKVEWKGDWSDSSRTWELLSPKEKMMLLRKNNDGEFWMSLKDFIAHFKLLVICKLTPGLLRHEVGQKWSYTMLEGRWEKGSTAGGPMTLPRARDTFWKNPQFLLSVWRPQEGEMFPKPCSVLVSLLQKPRHRHRNRKPPLAIGFYLFRMSKVSSRFGAMSHLAKPLWRFGLTVAAFNRGSEHVRQECQLLVCGSTELLPFFLLPGPQETLFPLQVSAPHSYPIFHWGTLDLANKRSLYSWLLAKGPRPGHQPGFFDDREKLPREFFLQNNPLSFPEAFLPEKEVSQELWLQPGTYLIVPCTSVACQESEFVLRVFSRKHIFYEIGSNSGIVFSKEIEDQTEGHDEVFAKLFEQCPEINAVQLQRILNHLTWSGLGSTRPLFSLDACQGILARLDLNASGTMSIQEFRDLWKQLTLYQEVFHKQDRAGSGCLNCAQLQAAMKDAGITLSHDICLLMLTRYGNPSLQMDFVSFVLLMLRAEEMESIFQNLTQDGKGIYLQKSEWLMMTLYC
ncbi:calpain-14 [Molossus nigricans]